MGQTAKKIETAVKSDVNYDDKSISIHHANDMENAVEIARKLHVRAI